MLQSLIDFLIQLFLWFGQLLFKVLVDLINFCVQQIAQFLTVVIGWIPDIHLPDTGLASALSVVSSSHFLGWLNWFFPVGYSLDMLTLTLTAALAIWVAKRVLSVAQVY